MKTKAELDAMLDELEKDVPKLLETHKANDGAFWNAFALEADVIVGNGCDHSEFVRARIDCILGSNGLIPSENEGEPCS